ncbi:UDP-N-acetyl glucosamine 2-epimerase [Geothrix limicola]|uniref:UDP-N-acetyl glucosamine 2-epimerase n=1 Tax=Geothrix limicola TaxID=2927978 RepID=A0ABQ5QJW6_9BACT|nr:UDP-N-acetylglucosamine 2-epimerase (non-hydrolyzing) [Geothrix limicola]GLH74838.1 UDP-N-acetyl glucosamine 2-epimerase [Geothrix limicola]
MKKLRVLTVVGTRPEIIRLSRVLARLEETTEHILVHTGQNYDYELNQVFFENLGIRKPDHFLDAVGDSLAETIGNIIAKVDKVLDERRPDALLVLGDTNSCLSVIPAKRRKIPIFHMEAGNRCFDQRVPEESNRKVVDHLADINLPYSGHARENLLREGLPTDRIVKTGSPMYEVLHSYREGIQGSGILERLNLAPQDYYLVSCHREENVDSDVNLPKFVDLLNHLAAVHGKRVIVSTHPRTRKRLESGGFTTDPRVELIKPFGYFDYVKLQENALVVLSDSGTITEESSILDFPALNIREAHERPEGMEEGAVIMTGMEIERVEQAIQVLHSAPVHAKRRTRLVKDYDAPQVSETVVRAIHSYVDYVNRFVWRKA